MEEIRDLLSRPAQHIRDPLRTGWVCSSDHFKSSVWISALRQLSLVVLVWRISNGDSDDNTFTFTCGAGVWRISNWDSDDNTKMVPISEKWRLRKGVECSANSSPRHFHWNLIRHSFIFSRDLIRHTSGFYAALSRASYVPKDQKPLLLFLFFILHFTSVIWHFLCMQPLSMLHTVSLQESPKTSKTW